jgi:hypothetical protein
MKPIAWTLAGVVSVLGIVLAAGAGGCNSSPESSSCTPQACGNGNTLQVCTKSDSSGTCKEAGYVVGTQTIYCASCADCSAAAAQADQLCGTLAVGDGGGGGDAGTGHDGASGSDSGGTTDAGKGTTCSPKVACGTKGTYEECTTVNTGGACTSIDYQTSDGHTFTCAGCTSCDAAAQALSEYCAGSTGNPTTTCGSSVTCGSEGYTYALCTTTSSSGTCQSESYEATSGVTYTCSSCGNCATAAQEMSSYCASMTTPTTTCGSSYSCGPNGATYYECTTDTGSTCTSADYETSDGQIYSCNSCSDCTSAYDSVVSYCDSLGTTGQQCGTTTCGSAATCCNCSGTPVCYTLISGETCTSIGCQ